MAAIEACVGVTAGADARDDDNREGETRVAEAVASADNGAATATAAAAVTVGTTVRICNLHLRPELNGLLGTVLAWDAAILRWRVRLDDGSVKNARATNLVVVTASAEANGGAAATAAHLASAALQPGSSVDFPLITELCDRLEAFPEEVPAATRVLSVALRDWREECLQRTLKALTIANEMMYNGMAVDAFRAEKNLRSALISLRQVRDSGFGYVVDENIRMLATEVERVVFAEGAMPPGRSELISRSEDSRVGTLGNLSWERFERAAGSAMSRADRILEKTAKNVESATQKAGKAFERMASSVGQEADRAWTSMATVTDDQVGQDGYPQERRAPNHAGVPHGAVLWALPHAERPAASAQISPPEGEFGGAPHGAASSASRHVPEDDWELQWALNASLTDAQHAPGSGPALDYAGIPQADAREAEASSASSAAQLAGREVAAQMMAVMAGHDVGASLGAAQVPCPRYEYDVAAELLRRLHDGDALAASLEETLVKVEVELEAVNRRILELEASRALPPAQGGEACARGAPLGGAGAEELKPDAEEAVAAASRASREQELRARLAELEAAVTCFSAP